MSQTETILLIVLGFSLASLIALFMGRMIWTAALRVGARRMQRQVPSSLIGLQTERDRLRAEYAMLAQRLGARLEEAKIRLAEQTAEVSRHSNRIHDFQTQPQSAAASSRLQTAEISKDNFHRLSTFLLISQGTTGYSPVLPSTTCNAC